jgi:hypothetical protein
MDSIGRRRFLGLLTAAAAVLAVPAHAEDPIERFSASDADVLRQVLSVLYGDGADGIDVVAKLERTLTYIDPDRHATILALPGLLDQLSRVLVPTFSAWHALSPEDQARALLDWQDSSLAFRRAVYAGLRLLLLSLAYTDASTWTEIGYPGPWIGRIEVPVHPPRFGELS